MKRRGRNDFLFDKGGVRGMGWLDFVADHPEADSFNLDYDHISVVECDDEVILQYQRLARAK